MINSIRFVLSVILLIGIVLFFENTAQAQSTLLQNGDFSSGTNGWYINFLGSSDGSFDVSSSALCVTIMQDSANTYDVMVGQSPIDFQAGIIYEISFDVMANAPRDLSFKTGFDAPPYNNYFYETVTVSTNWTTIKTQYTQQEDDALAQFQFHFATQGIGTTCVDNVSITAVSRDLARNGAFNAGIAPWDFVAVDGASINPYLSSEEMVIDVQSLGDNPYDARLLQRYIPIINGYTYSLRFDARATVPDGVNRAIYASVGKITADYDIYGGEVVQITNQMQSYQIDFMMNAPTDFCGKIEIHVGYETGGYVFDNFQLLTDISAETAPPPAGYTTQSMTGIPMRDYAEQLGITIGSAVDTPIFMCNPLHNEVLATEFNALTSANGMKMGPLVPIQGQYTWEFADALVDFTEDNNMEMHGHALVWHTQLPSWVENGTFNRDQMIDVMHNHIDTVAGRYAGRIDIWDVVNEAIDDNANFRQTPWQQNIGNDYVDLAFTRARQADPNAILLYNDYGISDLGPKSNAVYAMVSDMVNNGVPIDGVGFQMHWRIGDPPNPQVVKQNMARYAALGLDVHVTEIDVRIADANNDPTVLYQAADIYEEMFQVCIEAPNCDHFTTWGISDLDSWIPFNQAGFGRAHLFDENFDAKPAYHWLIDKLDALSQGNLIENGGFKSGENGWYFRFDNGSAGSYDSSSGAMCITITQDSVSNPWDVALGQSPVALQAGRVYEISFDVWTDSPRPVSYKTGFTAPPYTTYIYETANATNSWTTVQTEYTQSVDDPAAEFQFHLATQGAGTVCLDNVVLREKVVPTAVDMQTIESGQNTSQSNTVFILTLLMVLITTLPLLLPLKKVRK